jgi:hypothetical protein
LGQWGNRYSDGWVYGHGSFCVVSPGPCVLGVFKYMRNSDHTEVRQQMINVLNRPTNRRLRQQRGQTVEPMQGVVKDIFALERCWMRGHRHNRWLFAAMGVVVQQHQARALKAHRSPWKIKQAVLGL